MRININGSCVYDDVLGIGIPAVEQSNTRYVIPQIQPDKEALLRRILPEFIGFTGVTAMLSTLHPITASAAVTASTQLLVKEQSIIGLLQSIATPAAIAIALWGLIEWAVMGHAQGKKKLWDSLWLLIGIKFIPDIWMAIAS